MLVGSDCVIGNMLYRNQGNHDHLRLDILGGQNMKVEKLNSDGLTEAEAAENAEDARNKLEVIQGAKDFLKKVADNSQESVRITLQQGDRYFPQVMLIMAGVWDLTDWFFDFAHGLGIYPKEGPVNTDTEKLVFEYYPKGRPEL